MLFELEINCNGAFYHWKTKSQVPINVPRHDPIAGLGNPIVFVSRLCSGFHTLFSSRISKDTYSYETRNSGLE